MNAVNWRSRPNLYPPRGWRLANTNNSSKTSSGNQENVYHICITFFPFIIYLRYEFESMELKINIVGCYFEDMDVINN